MPTSNAPDGRAEADLPHLRLPSDLDLSRKPANIEYLWATEALPAQDGYEPDPSIAAFEADGWRRVTADRHPEMASVRAPFADAPDAVRADGGAVLMERPEGHPDARRAAIAARNAAQAALIASATMSDDEYAATRGRPEHKDGAGKWAPVARYRPSRMAGAA